VGTGPVRLGLCPSEGLYHPETGISHSKQLGCDLLASSMAYIEEGSCLVMAGWSLDKICVAIAGSNTALICQPPKGHDRWKEIRAKTPDCCEDQIDLEKIRDKIFQDKIDFKTLLNKKPLSGSKAEHTANS
jgi:hypothetical protein